MRLDVGLMHRLRGVAALDDHVGFLEAGFGVAFAEGDHLGNVGGFGWLRIDAGGEHIVVQDRCVGGHRGFHVDDVRQHLIVDMDQRESFVGNRLGGCGNRGQGMAFVQRLVPRHAVQRQIAEIHRAFADERFFRRDVGEVSRRYDGEHAFQCLGLAGVDRDDPSVGVGRAEHLAPQHSRRARISGEHRPAGHLVDPIRADGTGTNDFQAGIDIVHPTVSPRSSAAASMTARMTLS